MVYYQLNFSPCLQLPLVCCEPNYVSLLLPESIAVCIVSSCCMAVSHCLLVFLEFCIYVSTYESEVYTHCSTGVHHPLDKIVTTHTHTHTQVAKSLLCRQCMDSWTPASSQTSPRFLPCLNHHMVLSKPEPLNTPKRVKDSTHILYQE